MSSINIFDEIFNLQQRGIKGGEYGDINYKHSNNDVSKSITMNAHSTTPHSLALAFVGFSATSMVQKIPRVN